MDGAGGIMFWHCPSVCACVDSPTSLPLNSSFLLFDIYSFCCTIFVSRMLR